MHHAKPTQTASRHHLGNRFTIRLSEPDFESTLAAERWQRFGNEVRNVDKALAMFRGDFCPDRLLRGILLPAARSHLFNAFVAARMAASTWDRALSGEIYGFADNGTILLPENHRGDEAQRFEQGVCELTAPLWGGRATKHRRSARTRSRHRRRAPALTAGLEAAGLHQERRVMRLRPEQPSFTMLHNSDL